MPGSMHLKADCGELGQQYCGVHTLWFVSWKCEATTCQQVPLCHLWSTEFQILYYQICTLEYTLTLKLFKNYDDVPFSCLRADRASIWLMRTCSDSEEICVQQPHNSDPSEGLKPKMPAYILTYFAGVSNQAWNYYETYQILSSGSGLH